MSLRKFLPATVALRASASSFLLALAAASLPLLTGCQTQSTTASATQIESARSIMMLPRDKSKAAQQAMTPAQALDKLKAGNARFVAGQTQHNDLLAEVRATASGQYPYAAVVSCLDSRQPTEIVFDQGIGDVFNARIAGNIVNEDILGSLEFACAVAGTKLIVVVGHTSCGAVKGACDDVKLGNLTGLLDRIQPAVKRVPADVQPRDSHNSAFVQKVAVANVEVALAVIREKSPILRDLIDKGQVGLVGGMYDLQTGKVEFYSK
jgi:carbonic anhydrase